MRHGFVINADDIRPATHGKDRAYPLYHNEITTRSEVNERFLSRRINMKDGRHFCIFILKFKIGELPIIKYANRRNFIRTT